MGRKGFLSYLSPLPTELLPSEWPYGDTPEIRCHFLPSVGLVELNLGPCLGYHTPARLQRTGSRRCGTEPSYHFLCGWEGADRLIRILRDSWWSISARRRSRLTEGCT
ncbi:UNVERIFIED_CONTAM: hypothetical protein Sradi_6903100 [Sesamum radiatum]|uniref:Uncharacterized protein n=1 Tax=Sesamum radiatum TaxID=300843 RepID=A0AAW2JIL8_SESRA